MPTNKTPMSTTTKITLLIILGLILAGELVESFSSLSPLSSPTTAARMRCPRWQQSSMLRPFAMRTHPLLSSASSSAPVSSTIRVASSLVVKEKPRIEGLPEFGTDRLYHITNVDEYEALLESNRDKLIILKVFAPWCKACKALAPKFLALTRDEKYQDLPVIWADLNIQGNKEFVKSIGVLKLPTVQLYARNGIKTDTFPCGPSKISILRQKLAQLVNDNVDAKTRQLNAVIAPDGMTVVGKTANEMPFTATGTLAAGLESLPKPRTDGLYHITNEDEYKALLEANPDKLIILKVFAPWCKACKFLAPKFRSLARDEKYQDLPVIWADLNIQGNKEFVKSIGVLKLPTVQLYARNGLKVDTFPCGPSKLTILRQKLAQFVHDHVDTKKRQLKSVVAPGDMAAISKTVTEMI